MAAPERKASWLQQLKDQERTDIQQALGYIILLIEARTRAVAMVGLQDVLRDLHAAKGNNVPIEHICGVLWRAVDHVDVERAWPCNLAIRPILLMVVQEYHTRQGMTSSRALDSLRSARAELELWQPPVREAFTLLGWIRRFFGRFAH